VLEYQDDAPSSPAASSDSSASADGDAAAAALQARHSLSVEASVEYSQLGCNSVHKIWAMVKLKAVPTLPTTAPSSHIGPPRPQPRFCGVDFVLAIDRSTSMGLDSKLAFVKATIDYFVSQLDETHRFCLIVFNQNVDMVTGELLPMTIANKQLVLEKLRSVTAEGSTNISEALATCLGVVQTRPAEEVKARTASILLFTDGLANAGARGADFKDTLQGVRDVLGDQQNASPAAAGREFTPQVYNTTINTFGFGIDHDSQMLQDIAFSSRGGAYHYIENVESIPATFGAVLDGITSTAAHSIEVTLEGLDGCRLVNFYTRYPIVELNPVKKYCIQLGSMFMGEERCVLFKLSLRKIGHELLQHRLVSANCRYTNALTGEDVGFNQVSAVSLMPLYADIIIQRPLHSNKVRGKPAVELDKHINRYTAAAAIEEAIAAANLRDFHGAQDKLHAVIDCVQKSSSGVSGDPYIEGARRVWLSAFSFFSSPFPRGFFLC
jgi:Mg-chelatase subunit ChlD